jgi:hypothetical protein
MPRRLRTPRLCPTRRSQRRTSHRSRPQHRPQNRKRPPIPRPDSRHRWTRNPLRGVRQINLQKPPRYPLGSMPQKIHTEEGMRLRPHFLKCLCLIFCVGLGAGCSLHGNKMEKEPKNLTPNIQIQRAMYYCWFVKNDGSVLSGYDIKSFFSSSPVDPAERLFTTLEEVARTIAKYETHWPDITPEPPGEVPWVWTVRGLTTNETAELNNLLKKALK